ncbi:DUF2243 domain-containing protein [Siminovitchia sp. 179-K 8D1 HS]|uniref:DUF2243 domain-containing protein n=1 Tax=Siminovitchia sp. 179-K 8D1 HS TaxID=3142385 RepID=UPI0039A21562
MKKDQSGAAPLEYSPQNIWAGFLFGVGLITFTDEFVFHQLLQWHHFYDNSTTKIGIVSDGFFHAFSWFATIGGLFMFADLRRRHALRRKKWWGGVLLGAGAFQLYDGIVQHKLMRIHQIRYVDSLFGYDFVWNAAAVVLLIGGASLVFRARKESSEKRRDSR